jgi:N-acyl-D-aspartate/D-glutamate deacylase
MYDLILKGGRIYDGSGMPSFIGDVAMSNGRIEEIGRINTAADQVLDVGGLAVAPGIIDFHTTSTRNFGGIRWRHRPPNTASPPS